MFYDSLSQVDPEIAGCIQEEEHRQNNELQMIASENFASLAVRQAQGSVLTNKYAEGYPAKRYYGGCEFADQIESIAIERAKQLFNCNYVNVQPHSGSQANQAVFLALLQPEDTVLGMSLDCGGHLTHGFPANMSGKWFKCVHYNVDRQNYLIDYDEVEALAIKHQPKMIIAGYSAYTRQLDFKRFKDIADKVGAKLMVDMAHIAGLVATGAHPSPWPHADIVTSTTHKTLRGPRGGMIMTNDEKLAKKINSAVFPGIQGGPLVHVIAAKAVAFKEALDPSFKSYIEQVIHNAQVLSSTLLQGGYQVLTGGTDNHMVLIDLRAQQIFGQQAETALSQVGIICNKNSIPFDTTSPTVASGLRLGSPACTTKGMKDQEFATIGKLIGQVLDNLQSNNIDSDSIKEQVQSLCRSF